jgi:hypothetical protein
MPRIATRHAHRLAYRQRFSVGVRMLGCLVLLAGCMVLAAVAAEATKGAMSKTSWLAVSLGLLLAICGAVLLAGERGKLIDREERTVTRWWGIARPLWYHTREVRAFQAVGIDPYHEAGVIRYRVCLCGAQIEPLELFHLANQQAAEGAARQVATFLSLGIGPPPAAVAIARAVTGPAEAAPAAAPSAPAPLDDRWVHSRPWHRRVRLVGVALLSLAGVLLLGVVGSAASHDARWLGWLAIAAPAFALGLWLLCGGRKVEIDRAGQTARIWQVWPLAPAVYDLTSFFAVILAPAIAEAPDGEPAMCLVGLVGPEQLRLELISSMPCNAARAAAVQLAATAGLPLIDESQPAVRTV